MQHEANQLQAFTNYTLVLDFLLTNYLTYLNNRNQTPSLSMMKFPFEDLSTGVITVMILTSLLSVVWAVCVTYLVVQIICRRRSQKVAAGKSAASNRGCGDSLLENEGSLGTITSAQRLALLSPPAITNATNGSVIGPQLTRFELQRSPCWDRPVKWQWTAPRSGTSPMISSSASSLPTSIIKGDSQRRKFGYEKRVHLQTGFDRQRLDVMGLFDGRKKKTKRSLRVKSFTASSSTASTSAPADDLTRNDSSLPNLSVSFDDV